MMKHNRITPHLFITHFFPLRPEKGPPDYWLRIGHFIGCNNNNNKMDIVWNYIRFPFSQHNQFNPINLEVRTKKKGSKHNKMKLFITHDGSVGYSKIHVCNNYSLSGTPNVDIQFPSIPLNFDFIYCQLWPVVHCSFHCNSSNAPYITTSVT